MAFEIFGEMLYCPQTESLTEFPSPESLKKRIIISTKPPKEFQQSDSISKSKAGPDECETPDEKFWGLELSDSVSKLTEDKVREKNTFITFNQGVKVEK